MVEGERATFKLRRVCERIKLKQAELAKEAGIGTSSLNYYFRESKNGFQGEFLPSNKPWAGKVRAVLIRHGVDLETIAELFGRQQTEDIHEMRREIAELHRKMDLLLAHIRLNNQQHNSPTKL